MGHPLLELVNEREIVACYIAVVAALADPALIWIGISEHARVDVLVAQSTVFMAPCSWNQPRAGLDGNGLIGRWIVSALPSVCSDWLKLGPHSYFASIEDRYVPRLVVFGDSVDSLEVLSLPAPIGVKHHPDVKRLPTGAEIDHLLSQ